MCVKFHEILKQERLKAGLKQNQLSERLGVSSAYMAKLEKGGNTPSLEFISKLAAALELDPVTLFLASLEESRLPECMYDPIRKLKQEHELMTQDAGFREIVDKMRILDAESRGEFVRIFNDLLNLCIERENSGNHLVNPLK